MSKRDHNTGNYNRNIATTCCGWLSKNSTNEQVKLTRKIIGLRLDSSLLKIIYEKIFASAPNCYLYMKDKKCLNVLTHEKYNNDRTNNRSMYVVPLSQPTPIYKSFL